MVKISNNLEISTLFNNKMIFVEKRRRENVKTLIPSILNGAKKQQKKNKTITPVCNLKQIYIY